MPGERLRGIYRTDPGCELLVRTFPPFRKLLFTFTSAHRDAHPNAIAISATVVDRDQGFYPDHHPVRTLRLSWSRYTIQALGDTLTRIAIIFGTTREELQRANCMDYNDVNIRAGDTLFVPPGGPHYYCYQYQAARHRPPCRHRYLHRHAYAGKHIHVYFHTYLNQFAAHPHIHPDRNGHIYPDRYGYIYADRFSHFYPDLHGDTRPTVSNADGYKNLYSDRNQFTGKYVYSYSNVHSNQIEQ